MISKNIKLDFVKIYEKILEYKPDLKPNSILFYLGNIKKINKEVFECENEYIINLKLFDNFEDIHKYLEDNIKSISTKKNIISSILVVLGAYSSKSSSLENYQEYHKSLSKQREENYLDNNMSDKEKTNWISMKEVSEKIDEIKKIISESELLTRKHLDYYQRYLILSLYTLLPPLRNDYATVKVLQDSKFGVDELEDTCIDTEFNYINLTTKKLLLCTYKTKKFYGIKKIDISNGLLDIIIEWESIKSKFYKEKKNDFLLINTTSGTSMKSNSLTKYLNKIFYPKKISTTMLRKIYLSEKYPVIVSYRDQVHDAMVMGHSLSMQKMVYSKKLN